MKLIKNQKVGASMTDTLANIRFNAVFHARNQQLRNSCWYAAGFSATI